jgi:hypothetical protein
MNTTQKKIVCFLPGVGTPVSLYYAVTNKELRNTGLKGLAMLPAAIIVGSMGTILPSSLTLLAGAYIYWSIIALAGGWGFLTMLVAWRAIEGNLAPIAVSAEPEKHEAPELIPSASVSEVLPELNADSILSGIEHLPEAEKKELVTEIIKKM